MRDELRQSEQREREALRVANEQREQLSTVSQRLEQLAATESTRERERTRAVSTADEAARNLHRELTLEKQARESVERKLSERETTLNEHREYALIV